LQGKANRSAQGRPVGQLIACLRDAHRHATKADHMATRRDDVNVVTLDARVLARTWATGLPGFNAVLDLERPRRAGEGEEPNGLAG